MNITTIGLDIAKNVFQVHGMDRNDKAVLRKKVSRSKVIEFFVKLPACLIGMEACPGAHHWARELMKLGHRVKLMPAQYVKAYLKGNKNDGNDAEAICEAVSRPGMRFVAMNTEAQQDIQMLHRIRSRVIGVHTHHRSLPCKPGGVHIYAGYIHLGCLSPAKYSSNIRWIKI